MLFASLSPRLQTPREGAELAGLVWDPQLFRGQCECHLLVFKWL